MTHRFDVARRRDIIERWCILAEQRLDYLSNLFETGRWRRFHSETAFMENIQEAKTAVETWRMLLMREGATNNSALDTSWLAKPLPPRRGAFERDAVSQALPRSLRIVADQAASDGPAQKAAPSDQAEAVSTIDDTIDDDVWKRGPNLVAVQQRYPLLPHAL